MVIPNGKLKELLAQDGLINPEDFGEFVNESNRMGHAISDILIARGIMSEDYYNELLAKYFGVEKANLNESSIDESILNLLPENISRDRRAVPFRREPDGSIAVALENPSDLETIEYLRQYLKVDIKAYFASPGDMNVGLSLYSRRGAQDYIKIIQENVAASLRSKLSGDAEAAQNIPIVAILDNIVAYGVSLRASDIHLEILEDALLIRYRIDGMLHEMFRLPKEVHAALTARVKLLSMMKLDEHSKPQDGRFRENIGPHSIDIRVSIIPTFFGEKTEMRLLTDTERPLSFEELGMDKELIETITNNIHKTYGLVLISGPTGAGKTTTLYSILNILNKPEVNIVTIEDPIEYNIKYVNQIQVNTRAGITFATALRSILRQDPNIILVGEIRDEETADIAINAALTGHLLLSTVHTNDALTVVPRLIDLKVPPFLVAAVINATFAQRLVGRVCQNCIESYKPSQAILDIIKRQLSDLNRGTRAVPKMLYRGKGCNQCGLSGLKGRIGIFETINFDDEVRKLIVDPDFTLDALKKLMDARGMVTMFEDGVTKAEKGMTTIEEVLRVIRE
ncbi:MAG: GspE/PulE family protein [bacterium]|nr:GspE/PulE family protein [bacterium]